ncbi:peptide ABC transporter substrate-binding protein [Longimycelium tulufanense]|uniref:Peptide ABC transporter substrate-binding protein n=1 Tax=Longimycelium tulufanense TaxID=907463 RepID=A0A8J3FUF2_9PSEU|nr:ABC transporter family substrate-binding protein [Longimycelium tulufanense]GGM43072.1 peptide ABC transporter substrate-binding protein [Longimycelium tulufanense]
MGSARRGTPRLMRRGAVVLAAVAGMAGCTNSPPPPLVTSPVAETSPTRQPNLNEVVVGVDTVAGGLNPHALSDQNQTSWALASVLLPSPFRPGPDGSPQLDRTLMASAEVTRSEPFTVTYTIRQQAAWSDGAPIAAEDFVYLWERMRSEPGVVDPAGYRLISKVNSREGGKTVEVVFDKPYPGWRSLFDNLLPAHLLKDAPGGWARALKDGYPVYGGPFAVRSLDRDRGEIVLERNDRYWEKPAVLERIVLRAADHGGLARAVGSGDDQAAVVQADAVAMRMLRELGENIQLHEVPRPTVVQLLLRPSSSRLADPKVRSAVAAALDRPALIAAGTGNGPSAKLVADAQVLAPSQPGYQPTAPAGAPAKPNPKATEQLLTEAGYTRDAAGWTKDGQALSLVIAAPGKQEPYHTLATLLQRQLSAAGITTNVITPDATRFYDMLTKPSPDGEGNGVDIAVVARPVDADGASSLASTFGCRATLPGGGGQAPPNPAGFCDPELQPTIEQALTGQLPLPEALGRVESALWRQAVALPLFQLSDVLVSRPEVTGVQPGPPLVSPFTDAAQWRRDAR